MLQQINGVTDKDFSEHDDAGSQIPGTRSSNAEAGFNGQKIRVKRKDEKLQKWGSKDHKDTLGLWKGEEEMSLSRAYHLWPNVRDVDLFRDFYWNNLSVKPRVITTRQLGRDKDKNKNPDVKLYITWENAEVVKDVISSSRLLCVSQDSKVRRAFFNHDLTRLSLKRHTRILALLSPSIFF